MRTMKGFEGEEFKMAQHIVVTEYDPAWREMFEAEAVMIQKILGNNCAAIYHIGSTSVTGLAAKPIIDIMPVVQHLETVDSVSDEFVRIGYEYLGEFGIKGRRYLRKGGDERTHQIHIFSKDNRRDIERHLAVKHYLQTHPAVRQAYARLKIELAQKYPYDIDGYCDGKEAFVQKMESDALKWRKLEMEIHGSIDRIEWLENCLNS